MYFNQPKPKPFREQIFNGKWSDIPDNYTYFADLSRRPTASPSGEISLNAIAEARNVSLRGVIWRMLLNNKLATKLHLRADKCNSDIEKMLSYAIRNTIKIVFDYDNVTVTTLNEYKQLAKQVYKEYDSSTHDRELTDDIRTIVAPVAHPKWYDKNNPKIPDITAIDIE